MGPAEHKMFQALNGTFPEKIDLINSPVERKLHLGSGVEVDPKWTNIDRSYAKPLPKQGKQVQLDILRLNEHYKPGSADLILSHHVVEHLSYRVVLDAIKQWAEILAPGGCMYICVPEVAWAIDCARGGPHWALQPDYRRGKFDVKVMDWLRVNALAYQGGDHKSIWWPRALVEALQGAGLKAKQWIREHHVNATHWLPCCEVAAVGLKE